MNQLKVIVHHQARVLTTGQLAESYGTDVKVISNNYTRNAERYSEGKHFIRLTGEELKNFKAIHQIDESLKFASTLYLWTEKGAWLHAKSLNTDAAWDAYEMLVDEYYSIKELLTAEQQLRKQLELSLLTSERVDQVETKVEKVVEKVQVLVETMRIDGVEEYRIRNSGQAKVIQVLGGKESKAYEMISKKVFSQLWSEFKRFFKIPRYGELPKTKLDKALEFIEVWEPDTAIRMEIKALNAQQQFKLIEGGNS